MIRKHSDRETPSYMRLCLSSTVIRGGKSQYWRKISLSSVSELGSDTKTDISDIQNYSLQHFVTPQDSVILDTRLEIGGRV